MCWSLRDGKMGGCGLRRGRGRGWGRGRPARVDDCFEDVVVWLACLLLALDLAGAGRVRRSSWLGLATAAVVVGRTESKAGPRFVRQEGSLEFNLRLLPFLLPRPGWRTHPIDEMRSRRAKVTSGEKGEERGSHVTSSSSSGCPLLLTRGAGNIHLETYAFVMRMQSRFVSH